jgi:type IX secretion system PorP/SprF family membrane protein
MLRSFLSILLFSFIAPVYAQFEPQFTQYMYNKYLANPAYAGSADALEISVLHRSQYVGISHKAISTQAINFNLPIYLISSGIGITVINDFIGVQRSTYIALNYDYRKRFKWGNMGIGLGAGIIQNALDGSKLRAPFGNYNGGVDHNDDYLPLNLNQGVAPDLSFGIYFNSVKYFAGASINHIAFSSSRITAPLNARINFGRNLFFMGGYDFSISKKLRIMPSCFIKSDLKKVQVDISGTLTIIDNILTGISFRGYTKNMIDAFAIIGGFRFKGFQLVYSYDANVSYLSKFNSGSHEISLRYQRVFAKKQSRGYFYNNPRFN